MTLRRSKDGWGVQGQVPEIIIMKIRNKRSTIDAYPGKLFIFNVLIVGLEL